MKILGIESAALTASVALVTDGILTAEYTVTDKKTHSQTLLPMLDELKRSLGLELETLDAIAISAGPGSFTGLRIGAATAKGLGLVLQKPLVAVSTLEALAYNLAGSNSLICPVMDARRSQVYNGLYRRKATEDGNFSSGGSLETVIAPRAVSAEALVKELNARGAAVIFVLRRPSPCRMRSRRRITAARGPLRSRRSEKFTRLRERPFPRKPLRPNT